jgi:quercetin dioxygenase-like cupin family protein
LRASENVDDSSREKESSMRRVITGLDADGRSTVVSDGPPPVAFRATSASGIEKTAASTPPRAVAPGEAVVHELWALDDRPERRTTDPTVGIEQPAYDPPPATTKWIITEMGPHLDAAMHETPTVDYGLVVAGSVDLGLEAGTVRLEAGDTVLVNGVRHSWLAGPEGCVIATVLVGLHADAR